MGPPGVAGPVGGLLIGPLLLGESAVDAKRAPTPFCRVQAPKEKSKSARSTVPIAANLRVRSLTNVLNLIMPSLKLIKPANQKLETYKSISRVAQNLSADRQSVSRAALTPGPARVALSQRRQFHYATQAEVR